MRNLLILLFLVLLTSAVQAQPVGTSFTYQGELSVVESPGKDAPADGPFDFTFTLFDAASDGVAVGTPFVAQDVTVSDGVFTVELDFGIEPFNGDPLWLKIEVRDGSSSGAFTELSPRHALRSAPFAVLAAKVPEGSVGAFEVLPSEVQLRIAEACPAGSALRAIAEDGSVICEIDSDEQILTLTDLSLAISNGNAVDLGSLTSDNDASNELNTGVNFDGTNLTVSDAGGDLTADLSALINNDENERNTGVSFDGTNLTVSDAGGDLSADLSALVNDDEDELNTGIGFDGTTLTISDAGGDQSVALTGLINDDTNELNTGFALAGTTLSVTDAGGVQSADLSVFLDNTDAQTLSLDLDTTSLIISGGNAVDLSTLFNDNDPTNELNTAVSFDGTSLSIVDAGGTLSADLSALSDSAAEALAKLSTVDGADSGLDADLLDGLQASEIIAAASQDNRTTITSLPFTITAPGSYIVTQNLVNTTDDTDGILVQASNVTIDLGGFRLSADMSPDDNIISNRRGISVASGNSNIHILNGHIDNWGASGIDASNCAGCIFEQLTVTNSRFDGVRTGKNAVLGHVIASFNGDSGFELDSGSVLANCTAQGNDEHGFVSGLGRSTGLGISIINSTALENLQNGFSLDDGATVLASAALDNMEHGFLMFGSGTIQESSAYDNGFNGFDVEASMLRDNVASQNGSDATSQNEDNGFRVSSDSYLLNNHAYENDGAGIRVTSSDVVIENNTAIDNDRAGIESRVGDAGAASTASLYIRNRAAGNEGGNNYDIAAGNSFGPIVDVTSAGNLAAIANADHPMANFEY